MVKLQDFKKLSLDAYSKEKLTNNRLRSINGGSIPTCDGDREDALYGNGMTSIRLEDIGQYMLRPDVTR